MTISADVYNLKLFSSTIASEVAIVAGFLLLTFPSGLILKVAGVALEVIGIYGCHTIDYVMQGKERFTKENQEDLAKRFQTCLTCKALLLNAAIIGTLSLCYLISQGDM